MTNLEQVSLRLVQEKEIKYHKPISNTEDARELMRDFLKGMDREVFVVVNLSTTNKPLNFTVVHIGTLSQSVVHPREVFKAAILSNAAKIICFHNHPSGGTVPSVQDIKITEILIEAGELLGIPLIDHVIITDEGYASIIHLAN